VTTAGASAGRPILPVSLRRPAAVVVVLTALVFAALAARYQGGSSARWLDRRIESLVGSSDAARWIPDALIAFGNEWSVVLLALLISGLAFALERRRLAVLAIAGPGLTGLATTSAKPLIGRTIDGGLAFPSGHTGGATALGIVAALLLISIVRPNSRTTVALLVIGAVVSGGTMAFALIAEDIHYATDTAGGFCVAVAVVLASALVIERCAERVGRPPAAPHGPARRARSAS
jgi:membrane-associated phospholipid phosphatase